MIFVSLEYKQIPKNVIGHLILNFFKTRFVNLGLKNHSYGALNADQTPNSLITRLARYPLPHVKTPTDPLPKRCNMTPSFYSDSE